MVSAQGPGLGSRSTGAGLLPRAAAPPAQVETRLTSKRLPSALHAASRRSTVGAHDTGPRLPYNLVSALGWRLAPSDLRRFMCLFALRLCSCNRTEKACSTHSQILSICSFTELLCTAESSTDTPSALLLLRPSTRYKNSMLLSASTSSAQRTDSDRFGKLIHRAVDSSPIRYTHSTPFTILSIPHQMGKKGRNLSLPLAA